MKRSSESRGLHKMSKFNLCVYVFQLLDVNRWNTYLDVHNSDHHCRRSKLASKLFLLTFQTP